ncbi:MAG TPA: hypothetical protein VJ770_20860 [Stellaceae bacterium]|nr:hypothetical protein [Stellaceae bacterium]
MIGLVLSEDLVEVAACADEILRSVDQIMPSLSTRCGGRERAAVLLPGLRGCRFRPPPCGRGPLLLVLLETLLSQVQIALRLHQQLLNVVESGVCPASAVSLRGKDARPMGIAAAAVEAGCPQCPERRIAEDAIVCAIGKGENPRPEGIIVYILAPGAFAALREGRPEVFCGVSVPSCSCQTDIRKAGCGQFLIQSQKDSRFSHERSTQAQAFRQTRRIAGADRVFAPRRAKRAIGRRDREAWRPFETLAFPCGGAFIWSLDPEREK